MLIDFSEFGVPQRRKRFIIVGTLDGQSDRYFELLWNKRTGFLSQKGLRTKVYVGTAISDLERVHGEKTSPDSEGFMAGVYAPPQNNYQGFLRKSYRGKNPDSHRFANHTKETVRIFKKCA